MKIRSLAATMVAVLHGKNLDETARFDMAPASSCHMPFTADQISYAGRASIDYYLKNDPVDNINIDRPLIKMLMAGKKEYVGALQYVVEQLRFSNDSNFQSYFGDGQVTYNRKRTLQQAKYQWGSFHDGFGLNEDELAQNGITMTDDRQATPTDSEKIQLTNLLKENQETLKLGFQENFDIMLHRDGTQDDEDIPGLSHLIQTDPTAAGVVGGLDQVTNTWWRNYASTGIAAASLIAGMETAWQACIRVGGSSPDFILAGTTFVSTYRAQAQTLANGGLTKQVVVGDSGGNRKGITLDASVGNGTQTGLYWKGVEIMWDPVMSVLDTLDAPAIPWEKRCYFINKRYLTLRPLKGHWLVSRRPPRVYDRYVHYWALTAKAALTTGKRNAHAVISVA